MGLESVDWITVAQDIVLDSQVRIKSMELVTSKNHKSLQISCTAMFSDPQWDREQSY
jgi:hypothetical protein